MNTKTERGSPSPSSPSGSKLPKFLQKQNRDRSRSMIESISSSSSTLASSSSSSPPPSETSKGSKSTAKHGSRKLFGSKEEKRSRSEDVGLPESPSSPGPYSNPNPNHYHHDDDNDDNDADDSFRQDSLQDEPPVIVEPVNIPRPRTRSERPLSDNYPSVNYYPSSSSARLTDFPSRLSGWFSHTFSTSTSDLTLPSLLSQQHIQASPKGKGSALLTAAKHGTRHLDKAVRYLMDSDATPDKCTDSIWILGVEHPGYEPTSPSAYHPPGTIRRGSISSRRQQSPVSNRGSPSSSPGHGGADPSLSQSQPASSNPKDLGRNWPPVFYADFTSRIWLTYRSHFQPIKDTSLEQLEAEVREYIPPAASSPPTKKWNWPLGGEKGWSSDSGWGCMLRTGQSLLANTLLHLHLGRDWRRPPHPVYTADYATYVQILTWFLDDPSPQCPFSVHRMALVGKALGVRVGQWFGPSTAAGAIKTLVRAFPQAGLGVYVSTDGGTIYESEVFEASHSSFGAPRRYARRNWGDRAVLILIGHRLGIDGVNPIYYDTLKTLYTWPQSVGIAGGRPSSSYYFVGSQADNLFYLDPHHARPAVPLRPPTLRETSPLSTRQTSPEPSYSSDRERERDRDKYPRTPHRHVRSPTSPTSARSSTSGNSSFSHRPPISPSPLQQQLSSSSAASSNSESSHTRWHTSAHPESDMDSRELEGSRLGDISELDPLQQHFVTAYSTADLKTFHCDRVRKMPLSGLDPSMLMGFLCKNEQEWIDFKAKVAELNSKYRATVLSIQDEPPNWPSDSEMGLESISEPDIDMPEDDDELEDGSSSEHGRSRSASVSSPDTSVRSQGGTGSGPGSKSEVDTEEDPIDPITPGPTRGTFEFGVEELPERMKREESTGSNSLDFEDEDDEEWVDPQFTPQTPAPTWTTPQQQQGGLEAPPMAKSHSMQSTISLDSDPGPGVVKHRKTKKSSSSQGTIHRSQSRRERQASSQSQEQYPFPATSDDPTEEGEHHMKPTGQYESGKRVPQMRTAKARDGGRTQSGGVRGVPTDDLDDF
ncbi:peptidase family C54-domain-containing protein [Cristinia sonorae]|uniref:Autophagy-related protein 4 n=1 Tax=Cristinia sonorae TaxID=1940300 RepID=A0A8K0XLT6_9AGAR|nr:peptidase family C54-domain-containing protein [Cristinia sonorae]